MVGGMNVKVVLFDLGGVVLGSPLSVIAEYEKEQEISSGSINRVIGNTGLEGAWSRLECGSITMAQFHSEFEDDCRAAGVSISSKNLMRKISEVTKPRSEMLEAIRRLRSSPLQVAALTNNWKNDREGTGAIKEYFDFFFESSELGMRKPDPRIYEHVCRILSVPPSSIVFLDDIGRNLKAAKQLGFTTIKVEDPFVALRALGNTLQMELID
jgi:epoxide hydrolase-like predicted phosphatase